MYWKDRINAHDIDFFDGWQKTAPDEFEGDEPSQALGIELCAGRPGVIFNLLLFFVFGNFCF